MHLRWYPSRGNRAVEQGTELCRGPLSQLGNEQSRCRLQPRPEEAGTGQTARGGRGQAARDPDAEKGRDRRSLHPVVLEPGAQS